MLVMVIVCSRVFLSRYLLVRNFDYSKWYIRFNCLDDLFAIIHSDSSFEILLYGENLSILQNKREHENSWNSWESKPITKLYGSFQISLCNSWWFTIDINNRQQNVLQKILCSSVGFENVLQSRGLIPSTGAHAFSYILVDDWSRNWWFLLGFLSL
jgi:hypothetical protein